MQHRSGRVGVEMGDDREQGSHCGLQLLRWRTLRGPRCHPRPPAAEPELRLVVDSDLVALCEACISACTQKREEKKNETFTNI